MRGARGIDLIRPLRDSRRARAIWKRFRRPQALDAICVSRGIGGSHERQSRVDGKAPDPAASGQGAAQN